MLRRCFKHLWLVLGIPAQPWKTLAVTSDSGRGAEASAKVTGSAEHRRPAKLKWQVVLSPWEQRVDALQQGVEEPALREEEEPLLRLLEEGEFLKQSCT